MTETVQIIRGAPTDVVRYITPGPKGEPGAPKTFRDRLGTALPQRDTVQDLGYVYDDTVTERTVRDPGHVDVRVYLRAAGITDPATEDCSAALADADTDATAAAIPLRHMVLCKVSSDLTFTAHHHFQRAGMLKPASGATLTMATFSVDDDLQQCFDLSDGGTVVLQ